MNRTSDLILAIMWTIVAIVDIVSCAVGNQPSWILVFAPLAIVLLNYWAKVFIDD